MQFGLLANVRRVSHGSAPYLPTPAVLFMSSAGENEGDGFFFSGWGRLPLSGNTHNETFHNIPFTLAHNGVCGLQNECYQKHSSKG